LLVSVQEKNNTTKHMVTLTDAYYNNLTNGKISKEELIRKSFEFLLERESQYSIMSKFNLKIINNYFPEYENVVLSNE